ncbi:MAG: CARDB domain-containing protein, partial [Candidatus Hodarchaeota archaeon]
VFSQAEHKFREAAIKVEDGDVNGARSIARDVEKEYRRSAIEVLKKVVLADAVKELKDAEDTIPKESFRGAKAELDEVEDFIKNQTKAEFAVKELVSEVNDRIQQALNVAGIEVVIAELPDLVIEKLALSPEIPEESEEVMIIAVIRNVGKRSADGISVHFSDNEGSEIGRASIEYLESGQVEEVKISTTTHEVGEFLVTVLVDPEDRIEESNEGNNEKQQYLRLEKPRVEGWCCLDGEVFASSEAECDERGGRFFSREEDARRYCRGYVVAPLPAKYPSFPTANLAVEDRVSIATLEKIADAHAHDLWGEEIARGRPFPLADVTEDVFAYVFPYIRGLYHFPEYEEIFDRIRNLRSRNQDYPETDAPVSIPYTELGQFGSIYVSARRTNFPILGASHSLHPYFLVGDLAQETAERHFDSKEVRLERIYFLNPHQEYFEFTSQKDRTIIHVNSLERKKPEEVLIREPFSPIPSEVLRQIEDAWERVTELTPIGIDEKDISKTHTKKLIQHYELVPVVNQTYWCVPTAKTMVAGFWDNYAKGKGTITGYGRLIDYWFEKLLNGNGKWKRNLPSFIDDIIDPNLKPPTWRKRSNGTAYANTAEFINEYYGYNFSFQETKATASNNWAWKILKNEIDSGRPVLWGSPGHANTAFGYRISSSGQKQVILYSTWGNTAQQQLREWNYNICSKIECLSPGGGTNGDHSIIISPDGGEMVYTSVPCEISWFVWGEKIKKTTLSFSEDDGKNWTILAYDLNTKPAWNSFAWLPGKATTKARIRIQCYTEKKEYISGDGSQKNFHIEQATLANITGKINYLRVHDLGTGYGPPKDFLDSEVIVRLDSDSQKAFGFQLRHGPFLPEHERMLSVLRDAFSKDKAVKFVYVKTGPKTGTILRVSIEK